MNEKDVRRIVAEMLANAAPRIVNEFHSKSDRDGASTAQHHTLGVDANQASPGNHTHDGINSKKLLVGKYTSFPQTASTNYSQSQFQIVIDVLRFLGAGA